MSTREAHQGPDWLKAVIILAAGLYFLRGVFVRKWDLLDSFTLIVHEAGHPLFGIFGETMGVAGGTLIQLIVPAAFIVSFLRQGQPFSSALMWLWLGNSLLYCSVYSADAVDQALPLFGAGDRIHDWGYLLGNMLWATPIVSGTFRLFGTLAILMGIVCGLMVAGIRLPVPALSAPRVAPPRRTAPRTVKKGARRGFKRPGAD